jgi:hypothetical protein
MEPPAIHAGGSNPKAKRLRPLLNPLKIKLKNLAQSLTAKSDRQFTTFTTHFTTTSPRFTTTLHRKIRKTPCKIATPPRRFNRKTNCSLQASDV